MGWTGNFGWDLSKSNKELICEEFFNNNEKFELVKASQKGSNVWILAKNKQSGEISASVVLCQRKKQEFMYKEVNITSGPNYYTMPKSWIKLISPTVWEHQFAKDWLEKFNENESKKVKVDIGSKYKCVAKYEIGWYGGKIIHKGEEFTVIVDKFRNRRKFFISDDGLKKTFYVISESTFFDCMVEKCSA